MKEIGPWRVRAVDIAFENPWIRIDDHDVVKPNGAPGAYGVVHFKNLAIGVLPIDAEGNVWLVGQHRFPSDRYSWELPEGGGPLSDDPLRSAQRELKEETGLIAANWAPICGFDVSNSVTDERAVCYYAWGLTEGEASPDPTEDLAVKKISFTSLIDMVLSGDISDSLTIIMTLMAQAQALRGAAPEPICDIIVGARR